MIPTHLRILIVEDSALFAAIQGTQIEIKEPQWIVASCASMKRALELVKEFRPHVIVLDLNLEDTAADETLALIPKLKAFGAKVLATSQEGDTTRQQIIEAGGDEFMPKKFGEKAFTFVKWITDLCSPS